MSNALQVKRESIAPGEVIDVVFRVNGNESVYEARVIEVVRAAVRVKIKRTGEVRLIHFKNLRQRPRPTNGASKPEQPKVVAAPEPPKLVALPIPPEAVPPKPTDLPPPVDEVSAWLQMGRELTSVVDAEILHVRAEGEALARQHTEIGLRIDANLRRLRELDEKRNAILEVVKKIES